MGVKLSRLFVWYCQTIGEESEWRNFCSMILSHIVDSSIDEQKTIISPIYEKNTFGREGNVDFDRGRESLSDGDAKLSFKEKGTLIDPIHTSMKNQRELFHCYCTSKINLLKDKLNPAVSSVNSFFTERRRDV
jgi:hypothetical protein